MRVPGMPSHGLSGEIFLIEEANTHGQLVQEQQHGGQLQGGVAARQHTLNEVAVGVSVCMRLRRGAVPDLAAAYTGYGQSSVLHASILPQDLITVRVPLDGMGCGGRENR